MGAMSGRNLNIYIFFSFCSNFERLGGYRMSSPRKHFPIAHFRLLGHISTARKPSKYRLLEGRKPIGKWLSITRYDSDQSKPIELSSGRKHFPIVHSFFDSSDTFQQLEVYRNFDYLKTGSPSERYFRLLDIISISGN